MLRHSQGKRSTRVPITFDTSTRDRHVVFKHYQESEVLPHNIQAGSGFFGNLLRTARRMAIPVGKSLVKPALPIDEQAVKTAPTTKGSLSKRMGAAAPTAAHKENLLTLWRVGVSAARHNI